MADGIFYPAVSGDDGWCSVNGIFSITTDYLTLGNNDDYAATTFIRFPTVNIPQGATIDSAYMKFTAQQGNNSVGAQVRISLNDTDNAVAPISKAEIDALALTTNHSDWGVLPIWVDGVIYNSPDFASALQEVINRAGWASENAVIVVVKDNGSVDYTWRWPSSVDYLSGAEKAELHVTWTEPATGEISEEINVLSEFDDNFGELNEDVSILSEFDNNWPEVNEDISVNSEFGVFAADILAEEDASVNSELTGAYAGELSEEASVNSAFEVARHLKIQDTLSAWGTLKWGWQKTITDSLAIADIASKILGIPVKEWLTLTDTETNNWTGVESISDSFYAVDISKVVKVYEDLIADGMAVTDAVKIALELIITDILACVDTVLNTGTFQHSIEDGMTLEDIAKRFFPKSISDSFAATDASLLDLLALLQISDSINITETSTPGLTINQTIADALDALDTVTVQQLLQELIRDGLNFEVIIEIDEELWECWVLNTGAFHPSVYSGYDYNSFALFNDVVYGCKSDGIYELAGDTDNGTAFHSGIILPETRFGSSYNKKFRKAWFGVSGDDLVMKLETESGYRTFHMTDAEMSISRDLKGRKWKISLEDFDELDFAELTPIILSRK